MTAAVQSGKRQTTVAETPLDRLAHRLSEDLAACDEILTGEFESAAPMIPKVAAHLIGAGGKRVRPLLTLAAARLCGYEGTMHRRLAAAVEYVHSATLLHDDVVDGSEMRRGRPAANRLWGNKPTILVGDYLYARAFQLMVDTGSIRVLRILADASAVIAEGEVLQLATIRNLGTTEAQHLQVIRAKTAALFSAATESGAVLAGAPDARAEALRLYGDALGIAFQLCDDALDYAGVDAQIGKKAGDDFREGKVTAPVLRAHALARPGEKEFWTRVIEKGEQDEGDLEQVVRLMRRDGAIEATLDEAQRYGDQAKRALAALPAGGLRDDLADLVDYVVRRDR